MPSEKTPTTNSADIAPFIDRDVLASVHDSIVEGFDQQEFGHQSMIELLALQEGKTVSQKLTEFLLKKLCSGEACTNAAIFPPGTLIAEGEQRHSCYLVLADQEGISIKKTVHHPDHGDIVLDLKTLEGPTVLGEIALFGNGRATATVELAESVRAIEITTEELLRILEEEPELEFDLRKIAAERIVETIRTVSRAEDEFRKASSERVRQSMRELFSFKKAQAILREKGSKTVLGSFMLTGESDEKEPLEQKFMVTVHTSTHCERQRVEEERRRILGYPLFFLSRGVTHKTVYRFKTVLTAKPNSITITVCPADQPEQAITTIEYSDEGRKAYIAGTYSEKLGLGGMKFVGQIYREAFSGVDQIDTTFHESQTVHYAYEHEGSDTMMAPSAWGAHSSVVAARKGFVTVADQIMPSSVWARSYKVEADVDNILTVLRHIERVCIPVDEKFFAKARMKQEQFSRLYDNIEIKDALLWAEQSLGDYLKNSALKLHPEVHKVLKMQMQRIAELWILIPQSESLAELE